MGNETTSQKRPRKQAFPEKDVTAFEEDQERGTPI